MAYGYGGPEVFGDFLGIGHAVKKLSRKARKVAGKLVKSRLIQIGVAGAAIVFPPVGVPAAAALAATAATLKACDSIDPVKRKAGRQVVVNTWSLAKRGHPDAQRAVGLMAFIRAKMKQARWQPPKVAAQPYAAPALPPARSPVSRFQVPARALPAPGALPRTGVQARFVVRDGQVIRES